MQRFFVAFFLIILTALQVGSGPVWAANVNFSGVVLPQQAGEAGAFKMPGNIVSFSDEVALSIPSGFGKSADLQITDASGEQVQRFKLLSISVGTGAQNEVALVPLSDARHQSFIVCNKVRCMRFDVIKY